MMASNIDNKLRCGPCLFNTGKVSRYCLL